MPITPLYASLLAVLFVLLSIRTLRLRGQYGVAVGPGKVPELHRAIRAHANFAEYVPITLLLLYFLETQTPNRLLVHVFCSALLLGRMCHAFGISQVNENLNFRVTGMALTFIALIGSAFRLIALYAFS